jgi:hypothetical protein
MDLTMNEFRAEIYYGLAECVNLEIDNDTITPEVSRYTVIDIVVSQEDRLNLEIDLWEFADSMRYMDKNTSAYLKDEDGLCAFNPYAPYVFDEEENELVTEKIGDVEEFRKLASIVKEVIEDVYEYANMLLLDCGQTFDECEDKDSYIEEMAYLETIIAKYCYEMYRQCRSIDD